MAENNKENRSVSEIIKENKTPVILGVAALILVIAIIAIVCRSCGKSENGAEADTARVEEATEIPQITPIFMYFVSKSDEGYTDYMAMTDELKSEYDGRVEFQIIDVDEDPDAKNNFPVEGNTPLLIMNNHDNNITAIEFRCTDKETLKKDIEAAFE